MKRHVKRTQDQENQIYIPTYTAQNNFIRTIFVIISPPSKGIKPLRHTRLQQNEENSQNDTEDKDQ